MRRSQVPVKSGDSNEKGEAEISMEEEGLHEGESVKAAGRSRKIQNSFPPTFQECQRISKLIVEPGRPCASSLSLPPLPFTIHFPPFSFPVMHRDTAPATV